MNYKLNDEGYIVETNETFTNGRWRMIDGKMVRVGDGSRGPVHYGSDDLGVKGVLNPADGKMYDSKAEYYKAVKAKGMVVVGDDPVRPSQPKTKSINWEKAVAETLQKTPLKGKKNGR